MTDIFVELRKPFPPEAIKQADLGFGPISYVDHPDVTDRLLSVCPAYQTKVVEVITDTALLEKNCTVGVILELTIGDVSRHEFGDGSNLKEAFSDALKRAAMRFGVALDLWGKQDSRSVAPAARAQAAQPASHAPAAKEGVQTAPFTVATLEGPNSNGWYELVTAGAGLKFATKKHDLLGGVAAGDNVMLSWKETTKGQYVNRYIEQVSVLPAGDLLAEDIPFGPAAF